uniref:integrase n=1 Tax=Cupriavidus taiwanensis TaxID=164546 RepID=UPI000E2FB895|nr:site-specific integrase [Cupriavidus taiwanensis]
MANFEKRGTTVRALVRMKGQRISATFDTEKEAHAWAKKTEKRINDGEQIRKFDDSTDPSVAYVLERYAREISPTKRGGVTEAYILRAAARDYPKLFNKRVTEFRTEDIEAYVKQRSSVTNKFGHKNTSGTILRELRVLSVAFKFAIKRWKMPFHDGDTPVRDITNRPKMPDHRKRRVSEDETKLICAQLDYVDGTAPQTRKQWTAWAFQFCLATAMRKGEVFAATWQHVHTDELYIHLPETKNGFARDVPLSPRALELLALLKQGKGAQKLVPVARKTADSHFFRVKLTLGIKDLHWHDTRHEATTQLAKKLTNTLELAAVTGHRSLAMLHRYFNPTATEMARKLV